MTARDTAVTDTEEQGVAATARQMKTALHAVYLLLWAGKLRGRKIDGKWRIESASVREHMQK